MSDDLLPPSDMTGRTVVITGASSGIGRHAAETLSALGAEVAIVGRNPERTRAVADQLGAEAFVADFGRLDDVRAVADRLLERYPRIHVLADNAGGMQKSRAYTVDRNERTFQESHLGGFLLTDLLLPRLVETATDAPSGSVRVVQTASLASRGGRIRLDDLDNQRGLWLGGWPAYCNVKLVNVLFARELARRTAGTGVSAYSFHPGLVRTSFGAENWLMNAIKVLSAGNYGISVEQGADPLIRLIASERIAAPSGTYFDRLRADGTTSPQADDAELAAALWEASATRVGR